MNTEHQDRHYRALAARAPGKLQRAGLETLSLSVQGAVGLSALGAVALSGLGAVGLSGTGTRGF